MDIDVNITPDGLSAEVNIKTSEEEENLRVNFEDIITALNTAGVTFGINETRIHKIVNERTFNDWIVVAEGQTPSDGEDGDIMFDFSTDGRKASLKEDAAGRVNIKDLNLIQNVKTGDVLCYLIPPKPGREGMTVKGEAIPASQGAPAVLPGGENVEVSEDGGKLKATIDGMVIWDGSKVTVTDTYTVDKVDASTGNIRFNGSVVVNGEVGEGFEIHAEKDVIVAMSVGRCVIYAGGDIRINGGILGQDKGNITSAKSIHAKFIQDVEHLKAKGAVVVEDYILNSNVNAGGPVVVKGGNGFIAGSTVASEAWIYAHTMGIEGSSTDTNLIIGHSPELIKEKYELSQSIYNKVKDFLKLKVSLTKLREIKKKNQLSPQQKELYGKIMSAIETIRYNLEEAEVKITDIMEKLNTSYSGHIYVENIIHEGTILMFGNASKEIFRQRAVTQFSLEKHEIIEKTFSMKPEIKAYLEESDG